jgi:hypothetical protein
MATPAERVSERHLHLPGVETCEWCEQPIPPDQLKEVRGRIAARERRLSLEATAALREDYEKERVESAARSQEQMNALRAEAAVVLDRLRAEGAERERAAREDASRTAQTAFEEHLARLAAERDQRENALRSQIDNHDARREQAELKIATLTAELQRVRTEEVAAAREQGRAEVQHASDSILLQAQQQVAELEQRLADAAEREGAAREDGSRTAQTAFDERLAYLTAERDQREDALRSQVSAHEIRCEKAEQKIGSLTGELLRARTEEVTAARERGRAEAQMALEASLIEARQQTAAAEQRLAEVRAAAAIDKDAALAEVTTKLTRATDRVIELEEARSDAMQQIQTLTVAHENTLHQRLREQHDALTQDKDQKLRESDARAFAERQKLQNTVADLTRQLEQVSAYERGEGAEINLYDVLKGAFETDRIKHVPKGAPGPDIIHEVLHHGKVCGKIIYDSKDRNDYKKEYARKLRNDQLALKADCAILASRRFPKKAGQLYQDSGVIVANPARVVVLAAILRRHILQVHALRLSNEEREAKTEALYKYITSEPCKQLLESVEKSLKELFDLDAAETEAHSRVWRQRGKLLNALLKVHGDLCAAFDRIIGTLE